MRKYIGKNPSEIQEIKKEFIAKDDNVLITVNNWHVQEYDGMFVGYLNDSNELMITDWLCELDEPVDLVVPNYVSIFKHKDTGEIHRGSFKVIQIKNPVKLYSDVTSYSGFTGKNKAKSFRVADSDWTIYVAIDKMFFQAQELEHVYLGDNLSFLPSGIEEDQQTIHLGMIRAFSSCPKLKTAHIEIQLNGHDLSFTSPTATHISTSLSAFADCSELETVYAPNLAVNVTFANCYKLKHATVRNNIGGTTATPGSDDNRGFTNCYELETVIFTDTITIINSSIFRNCYKLNFEIPASVTQLRGGNGGGIFQMDNVDSQIGSITLADRTEPITQTAYNRGGSNFYRNNNLSSETAHKILTYLTDSLTSTTSGTMNSMFRQCRFSSVTIPDNILRITSNMFSENPNLESVVIGSGVLAINNQAFQICPNLTDVTILATTPPTLSNISAFGENLSERSKKTFYIPSGSLSAYESATNWSSFAGQFVEV